MSGVQMVTTNCRQLVSQFGGCAKNGVRSGWAFGLYQTTGSRSPSLICISALYMNMVVWLHSVVLLCRWTNMAWLGMPIQSTTDCGSETTDMFGFANALRFVILACFNIFIRLSNGDHPIGKPLLRILTLMNYPHIVFSRASIISQLSADGFDSEFNGVTT